VYFFFQAEDGIRFFHVTGVQTCALPIYLEFLEATFAVNRLGAAFLPMNYRLAPDEWRYILEHAGAVALLTEPEFQGSIDPVLPDGVRHRLLLGADQAPDGWLDYTALVEANRGRQV